MFYWLVALTSTFLIQVGNIYLSNIIFVVWIIVRFFMGKEKYSLDRENVKIFIFYLMWVLLSTVVFSLQYVHFEVRNFVQFVYNLQYIILIADGTIDKNRLKHAMYVSSYLLAVTIIVLWVTVTGMMSITALMIHYRLWASEYIGGWPNSTVLPLLFGVYLEMTHIMRDRNTLGLARLVVLLFALLLCTSRTGYIGAAMIIGYFFLSDREGSGAGQKLVRYMAVMSAIAVIVYSLASMVMADANMRGRMFMVGDRLDIFTDMFAYISNRPLLGYGGNSVDVIYQLVGPTESGINWGHTHNTVLELLIRHGIVGAAAFILLMIKVSGRIINKEDKVMYWILWTLSLFQIFYKEFEFLLMLYLLVPAADTESQEMTEEPEYA